MGSEVVFELWSNKGKDFLRVLFSGQPMITSSPLGTLDMVPVEEFLAVRPSFAQFASSGPRTDFVGYSIWLRRSREISLALVEVDWIENAVWERGRNSGLSMDCYRARYGDEWYKGRRNRVHCCTLLPVEVQNERTRRAIAFRKSRLHFLNSLLPATIRTLGIHSVKSDQSRLSRSF